MAILRIVVAVFALTLLLSVGVAHPLDAQKLPQEPAARSTPPSQAASPIMEGQTAYVVLDLPPR